MPFFKDLRRRTASFRSNKSNSPDGSRGSNGTNSSVPDTRSSSTLNSVYATSTPPSTIQPHASTPNLTNSVSGTGAPVPPRPAPVTLSSSRLSMVVLPLPCAISRSRNELTFRSREAERPRPTGLLKQESNLHPLLPSLRPCLRTHG